MSKNQTRTHKMYRTHKKNRKSKKHKVNRMRHTKKNLYRKRHQIFTFPGSKGLPLFNNKDEKNVQNILVNKENRHFGNMIPGLRNM